MIVAVAADARVTPVHWIVLVEIATEPVLAETQPAAFEVVGAVQPAGTTMSTSPLPVPPVAAVYVKLIVWPVAPLATFDVGVVSVPEPSAE